MIAAIPFFCYSMEARESSHIEFMQIPQNGKNKGTKEGEIMVKMIFQDSWKSGGGQMV
jgi:hypothetical protein